MLHKWTLLLVIIGAVNSGLVTWTHVDLLTIVFGDVSHMISALIGLSGLYMLLTNYTTLIKKA